MTRQPVTEQKFRRRCNKDTCRETPCFINTWTLNLSQINSSNNVSRTWGNTERAAQLHGCDWTLLMKEAVMCEIAA